MDLTLTQPTPPSVSASLSASPTPSASTSTFDRSEISTRISAPYGQACISCAKAKCKCMFISNPISGSERGSSSACERCARLGRECKPSGGVRKRGAAISKRVAPSPASTGSSSSISAASRAANLEQKLEDLVAILKAQAGSVPPLAPASAPDPAPSQSSAGEPHLQGTFRENMRAELGLPVPSVTARCSHITNKIVSDGPPTVTPPASTGYATCSTTNSTPSPLTASAHDASMSAAQAEETLTRFRQQNLPFFPFIYIPPEMTYVTLFPVDFIHYVILKNPCS
jgi:hypothetical protein